MRKVPCIFDVGRAVFFSARRNESVAAATNVLRSIEKNMLASSGRMVEGDAQLAVDKVLQKCDKLDWGTSI